jgi:hypothetical protein
MAKKSSADADPDVDAQSPEVKDPSGMEHLGSQKDEAESLVKPEPQPAYQRVIGVKSRTTGDDREVHPCGLPLVLVRDRLALLGYPYLHVSKNTVRGINIHQEEYLKYELYRRDAPGRPVSLRRFVAAVRLWKKGAPLELPKPITIDEPEIT